MRRKFRPVLASSHLLIALLFLALAAGPALAQIDEIVVTARKKEESLKEVPVTITAFSSDDIQAAGIRDLYDVAALTPGLSFFNAQGEFLAVPVIRGVAPTDIFGENNAAIFVDGVFVSGREGLNFSQLDLERIEIVKGPQSALYGRNAFSGAINYVTRKPTYEFEAKSDLTAGNDGRIGGSVSLSGPIFGDTLRGRISGLYNEFDGSYDNALGDQDIGGFRYRSWQGSLNWTPSDRFDVSASLYYSNDEIDDAVTVGVTANCEPRVDSNLSITRLLNVCGQLPTLDEQAAMYREIGTPVSSQLSNLYFDQSIPVDKRANGENRDLIRANLNIDWDLDVGTLTFLTGYSNTEQTATVDGARALGEFQPYVYCTAAVPFGGGSYLCPGGPTGANLARLTTGLLQVEFLDQTEEISQEIRFTSPQDRAFRYSGGAYFFNVNADSGDGGVIASNQPAPGLPPNAFGPVLAAPAPPIIIGDSDDVELQAFRPWFRPNGDLDPLQRNVLEQETDSWSVFASAEYDFTERLTVDAQIRYGEETKNQTVYDWDEENLDVTAPRNLATAKDTWESVSGRLGAKFLVADAWMVYASIANGVKPGGFDSNNVDIRDNPETPENEARTDTVILPFDEETIVATEIGIKGTTMDGRLSLDMALYHNDWADIVIPQALERNPLTGDEFTQPESFNANAGDATVVGWEMVASYLVTENLTARLTTGYQDATFDSGRQESYATFPSFRPPDCQGEVVNDSPEEVSCLARSGDIAGNTLLRQPKWQGSFTLDYRRPITGDWELYARGDASYQGKIFVGNDNQSTLPARTTLNLKLGIESGRYSIELWGRNVFGEDSPIAAYRDVWFSNTSDPLQERPVQSTSDEFFPWRYSVTHPVLATYGITARVRFGDAAR